MKQSEMERAAEIMSDAKQSQMALGSRPKKRPVWLIIVVILFFVSVVCGMLLYNKGFFNQAAEENKNTKLYNPGPIHSFEPFTVNIANSYATRYLRVCINVECNSAKSQLRIVENELRIRDRVIDLLCAQSLEDLLDTTKRDHLRARIAEKIREAVGNTNEDPGWVKSVYFSEFTIQ
ncbi:MAG: hypothetical protein GX969_06600 [Firmicutes bacterium]|jgi:flagellar basal body-associated protein FliL|nr:hypothetical protein [Bacillota bacterium]